MSNKYYVNYTINGKEFVAILDGENEDKVKRYLKTQIKYPDKLTINFIRKPNTYKLILRDNGDISIYRNSDHHSMYHKVLYENECLLDNLKQAYKEYEKLRRYQK